MRFTLFLLALLLASPAWAGAWSKNCQFTGTTAGTVGTATYPETDPMVGAGARGCYRFNNADSTHIFKYVGVNATSALVCFDTDLFATAATAASSARVIPHFCPIGYAQTAATPLDSCFSIGGAISNVNLDGTEGPPSAQDACITVGPGVYAFEISVACVAGDTCQISVQGQGTK